MDDSCVILNQTFLADNHLHAYAQGAEACLTKEDMFDMLNCTEDTRKMRLHRLLPSSLHRGLGRLSLPRLSLLSGKGTRGTFCAKPSRQTKPKESTCHTDLWQACSSKEKNTSKLVRGRRGAVPSREVVSQNSVSGSDHQNELDLLGIERPASDPEQAASRISR